VRRSVQSASVAGVGQDVGDTDGDDHRVERQEDDDQGDRDDHRLGEAEQEDPAQHKQQEHGERDGVAGQEVREERVLQDVHRGVRRGQRDRDDPRGGDEAEQHEDDDLAPPEGQQALEHRHRALTVRALLGDPSVHRQDAQERQRDDEQRGQR
jgi:hypothetical protein